MAITFRDEKGAPLTHEELDANFRSFFFTASFGANVLLLQRKDGTSLQVPIGGEAFANFQANGGSIGDVFIANSQVTGSKMIIDLKSGSFYDKTKAPGSDGGSLSSDEWYIHFDPQTSAPYYVHFGSNFAISSSGYLYASGAIIEGEITASAGLIGGFNITPDAIHGPTTLGVPSFYISGSASTTESFISASNFNIKGSGDITGSAVLFSGGKIAGWEISNSKISKTTHVVLDATNESISINDETYGNKGIQLEYNDGTPRFYVGDGTGSFVQFDGTDVKVATTLLEISASNIEISSTEASMSLGGGDIKLLGNSSTIEVGPTNKVKLVSTADDSFIVAGTKTAFASNDAGIIMGMDSAVPTLDLTKDASNYFRFNTTSGVDIKTDTFKLDTTYFDIDTTTQRLNIFDTGSKEIIRLGEISDDASDLYGLKIFDGTGTGSAETIAMFGQQGNKIGGWEVTDSQIRTIPTAGFGENYGENEVGLVIHSSGKLESSNFATNLKGWRIDTTGNGSAEFENMRIRGTLKTTVFEKESVNVVGGQLMVANSTTIEPLVTEAGVIIAGSSSYAANAVTLSVANVSGFEEGEILKIKSVDATGFSVEYLYVSGSKRYSQDSSLVYNTGSIDPDGLFGELYVERSYGDVINVSSSIATLGEDIDNIETSFDVSSASGILQQSIIKVGEERFKVTGISSNTLTVIRDYHDTVADSHSNGTTVYLVDTDKEFLAGLVSTAKPYNAGQVLVSTGVFNTQKDISSGYILMNANPRDVSTPYMDIVERTGSGVYDLQLRSRLGDLSGLSSAYLYGNDEPGFGLYTENGFFRGAITAQTGSIAGILHVATVAGGLETGQKISIGRDVSGTNDGIYVNNNNYWYTDGAWKVGGSNNFISLDNFTDGNLVISTETFSLDTPNMVISSSLNSGTITMGVSASAITATAETGIYMDGLGKFRVGTGTSGANYIYWDGSTLNIKGSVDITGGTGATTAYVDQAETDAVSSAESFTNTATASLSGSIAGVTDTLDGKIFTDSAGRAVRPPTASAEGLYLASTNLGFYKDGEWKTYMDNQGDFFLTGSAGNKLAWDSSTGNLEIKGSITITGGNAATTDFVNTSTASLNTSISASLAGVSSSLASDLSGSTYTLTSAIQSAEAIATGKAAIFKQASPPTATGVGDMWIETDQGNRVRIWDGTTWAVSPDNTFDQTSLINSTSASLSSSIALDVFTDSSGKLVKTPSTSSAGLYLGDTNLGFYSGSEWKTYMANNGNFYLTGSDTNYLFWDGTSLNIAGAINITGGNATTQDDLNTATGSLETYADGVANTAESNANSFTNSATSSLSGSIAGAINTVSGALAENIQSGSSTAAAISASQALVNQGLQGVVDGKNSIFRQATPPTATAIGDTWIETDEGNRIRIWTGSVWEISTDSTFDQTSLISSTSASVALDIFTDSTGKIQKPASLSGEGLFMDSTNLGYYSGSEWKTYMANNGNFYLTGSETNYLAWDGSSLTISGNINVLGGNATTHAELDTATGSLETFASNAANEASSSLTGSIGNAQQTATLASGTAAGAAQAAATASAEALIAQTAAASAISRSVDAEGKITFNPTPSGQGLFMNADNLGFYSGSAWKTYMSASGDFYLSGDGDNGLSWDGEDLSVDGTIVARAGQIGGITLESNKLYNGTGTHGNTNTGFYVDSSSKFSLGDKLIWDGTNLSIAGSITITNATYATQASVDAATGSLETSITNTAATASAEASAAQSAAQTAATNALTSATSSLETSITNTAATASAATNAVQGALTSATSSLETNISNTAATASAEASAAQTAAENTAASALTSATSSLETSISNTAVTASAEASAAQTAATAVANTAQSTANAATGSAATAQTAANTAQGTANLATGSAAAAQATANTAVTRSVDASGKIAFNPTPTGTGLFMSADNLGYYETDTWKTYMSSSGDFYLAGDGNSGLSWDGSDLSIDGTIVARDGSIGGIELGADKMFISGGSHDNVNTPFFISSSGEFSLGDKLVWDGSNLSIEGSITITNSSFATTTQLSNAAATASAEASAAESAAILVAAASASAAQTNAIATSTANLNVSASALETFANTAAATSASAAQTAATNVANAAQGTANAATGSAAAAATAASNAATAASNAQSAVDDIETQLVLSSDGMELKDQSSNTLASYGTTTTIGATATEHISISSTELRLKDGSTTRMLLDSSGISMGNNISINSSGNATFSGDLSAAGGSFAGDLSAAGGTFAGSLRVGTTNTTVGTIIAGAESGASALQDGDAAADVNANSTTITGNKIRAGALLANNHSGTSDGSGFSTAGLALDLVSGGISAPNFFISSSGFTSFGGVVNAQAGITGSLIKGATLEGGTITGGILNGGVIYVPDANSPQFSVSAEGFMTASDAKISGEITATSGQIGDWIIDPVTNALRDNDSEIIFSPHPAEIQMFSGGDKKVIIAPSSTLTSTAGSSANFSTLGAPAVPSSTSTNPYYAVDDFNYGSLSATISNSTTGDKEIGITIPSFQIEAIPGGNQTVSNTAPSYDGTYEDQKHGLNIPSRKRSEATIHLQAIKVSDSAILGQVLLGKAVRHAGINSFTYYQASGSSSDVNDPFLSGQYSVIGDTDITLSDGSVKLAKDITTDDMLKVWDWTEDSNKISSGNIKEVLSKTVTGYYVVKTDTSEVAVSENHGFWLDDNEQIKVTELIKNESQIYVVDGNTIKYETVKDVYVVNESIDVYTFKVPGYNNYVSGNALSHNPISTSFAWETKTRSAIAAYSAPLTGGATTINISVNQAADYRLRYKTTFKTYSGQNSATNAAGSTTFTTTHHTANAFSSNPSYDGTVSVTVPTNFVELKAGGIQIVSDAAQYVRMPRLNQGQNSASTIFEAKGGTSITDALKPGANGSFDLGSSSRRWNNVYSEAGNFSGAVSTGALSVTGTITATGNITAFNSSDKRLKSNIVTLDGSLEKVLKLRGTRFDWIEGKEDIHPFKGNDIGFIAQELKEVIPEVVGEMHGGFYGVKYDKLTPLLVEAIKELKMEIDLLKSNSCNCKCKK